MKRNPSDLTKRNLDAAKKRHATLLKRIARLEAKLTKKKRKK